MAKKTQFQRAREWREGAGLSRLELADHLGVNRRTVTGMELGILSNGHSVDEHTFHRYRLMVKGWLSKAGDPF
jgi:transcriptional regulator with XRE-family HTH domain